MQSLKNTQGSPKNPPSPSLALGASLPPEEGASYFNNLPEDLLLNNLDKMNEKELLNSLKELPPKAHKMEYLILKKLKILESPLTSIQQARLLTLEELCKKPVADNQSQSVYFAKKKDEKEEKSLATSPATNSPSNNSPTIAPANFKEVYIPADGDCLYMSIFVGYLSPAVNHTTEFNKRLKKLIGKDFFKQTFIGGKSTIKIALPDALIKQLQDISSLRDLNFLKSKEMNDLIGIFKKNMGLDNGLWGGDNEIKILEKNLTLIIKELTMDPENPNSYIQFQRMSPENANNSSRLETIFVLRTNATPAEAIGNEVDFAIQIAQMESAISSNSRQHFRLVVKKDIEVLTTQVSNTNPSSNRAHSILNNILYRKPAIHDENKSPEYIINTQEIEKAKVLFNALGRNQWKIYIDHQHRFKVLIDRIISGKDKNEEDSQSQRRLIYDEGQHKGKQETEVNFYKNLREANERVEKNLGIFLDFKEYYAIHNIAMRHKVNSLNIRTSESSVPLPIYEQDPNLEQDEDVESFLSYGNPDDKGIYRIEHKIVGEGAIKEKFNHILNEYKDSIKSAQSNEQKLRAIAKAHLHLEWLHVFPDGNARTNKLILNKFLAENGFNLCILDTPLGAEHKGLEAWIEIISRGQKVWGREVENETPEKIKRYQEGKEEREKNKKEQEKERIREQNLAKKIGIKSDNKTEGDITSSSDDEEPDEAKARYAIERLREGNIKEALNTFKKIDHLPLQVPNLIFDTISPLLRKDRNLGLGFELVNYYIECLEENRNLYEMNNLRLLVAESSYELFLISNDKTTIQSSLLYLNTILNKTKSLKNKVNFFKLKIKDFIKKIALEIPEELLKNYGEIKEQIPELSQIIKESFYTNQQ